MEGSFRRSQAQLSGRVGVENMRAVLACFEVGWEAFSFFGGSCAWVLVAVVAVMSSCQQKMRGKKGRIE